VVERWGRSRYLKLYRAFNDEKLPGASAPATTRRAVRRTLGVSLGTLDRDLREYLGG